VDAQRQGHDVGSLLHGWSLAAPVRAILRIF
jgi:hypothetical protein